MRRNLACYRVALRGWSLIRPSSLQHRVVSLFPSPIIRIIHLAHAHSTRQQVSTLVLHLASHAPPCAHTPSIRVARILKLRSTIHLSPLPPKPHARRVQHAGSLSSRVQAGRRRRWRSGKVSAHHSVHPEVSWPYTLLRAYSSAPVARTRSAQPAILPPRTRMIREPQAGRAQFSMLICISLAQSLRRRVRPND